MPSDLSHQNPDNWDSDGFVPDNRYNYLTFNGVVNNVTVGLGGVDDNEVLPIQFTPGSLEIWLMSAPPPNQHLQYSVLKFRTNPLSQVVCENNQFFYLTFESNGQLFGVVELRLVDNYNFRPWIKFEMDYNSDQEWIPLNTDQVELFGVEQMDNIYHTYQLPEGAVSLGYHSINQDGSINGINTDYPIIAIGIEAKKNNFQILRNPEGSNETAMRIYARFKISNQEFRL